MSVSTKWEPKEVLHKVRDEIDRGFEEVVGLTPTGLTSSVTHWRPRVDISENESCIIVEYDLPGVSPEGIDLSITGRAVALKAEPRRLLEEDKRDYVRRERYRKQWKRVIELENEVDHEGIEARLDCGVLTVRLPKQATAESVGRRIPVT